MDILKEILLGIGTIIATVTIVSFFFFLLQERSRNKLIDKIIHVISLQNIVESEFTESMNVALRDRYNLSRVEHWTQLETDELEKIVDRYSLRSR